MRNVSLLGPFLGPKTGIIAIACLYLLSNRKLHPSGAMLGDMLSNGAGCFAIGGGKREERGGKWGMRGREVWIEGAGSGDRVPHCPPPQRGSTDDLLLLQISSSAV